MPQRVHETMHPTMALHATEALARVEDRRADRAQDHLASAPALDDRKPEAGRGVVVPPEAAQERGRLPHAKPGAARGIREAARPPRGPLRGIR